MRFNGFEEFQEYPKVLYDKDGAAKVVANLGEEQAAGAAWQFTTDSQIASTPTAENAGTPEVRRGRGRPPKALDQAAQPEEE